MDYTSVYIFCNGNGTGKQWLTNVTGSPKLTPFPNGGSNSKGSSDALYEWNLLDQGDDNYLIQSNDGGYYLVGNSSKKTDVSLVLDQDDASTWSFSTSTLGAGTPLNVKIMNPPSGENEYLFLYGNGSSGDVETVDSATYNTGTGTQWLILLNQTPQD